MIRMTLHSVQRILAWLPAFEFCVARVPAFGGGAVRASGPLAFAVWRRWARLAASAGPMLTDTQVKAAFLFNFVKFVEWPETSHEAGSSVVICVSGRDE